MQKNTELGHFWDSRSVKKLIILLNIFIYSSVLGTSGDWGGESVEQATF